jgi:hypothetical protein
VYRRACAYLGASFAAGVVRRDLERIALASHGVPIATFRCDAPARRGVFADERRVVVGDEGGQA